jgi:hypothetical protein
MHDYNVQRYRDSKTDKCPTEMKAARERVGIVFGSPEHQAIGRTCDDANCPSKYHWCPTCFLAPRCDCTMPHMWNTDDTWRIDQSYLTLHMERIACDNRYGMFTQTVRSIASGLTASSFCIKCSDNIRAKSGPISRVSGRTYLEQASNLWKIIGSAMCARCINIIDGFPCMHLGTKCPSTYLRLICPRLENYQGRRTGQGVASHESEQIDSIREAVRGQCEAVNGARSDAWTHFWSPDGPIKSLSIICDEPVGVKKTGRMSTV